jgi:thiosulfate dehydrogenase [quinone] large subunit
VLVAFFESIKYVGHLFPIALLRVYLGYIYLNQALTRYGSDFLESPRLAEAALHWLPRSLAPTWYQAFVEKVLVPNWPLFAVAITLSEFLIGLSLLFGYLVRPFCILGFLVSLNLLWIFGPDTADYYHTQIAIFLTLAWLGAGRCLGFDYFFYKRRRGIWW